MLLKKWRKDYADEAVASIGVDTPVPARIPTGILEFDVNSGGGFPENHMSIVAGGPDVGKSLLLYCTMATYQADHPDKVVAFLDLEDNYTSEWGAAIGIDEKRLLRLSPTYGEQAADMIAAVIEDADDVGLLCVDSLAQLVSSKEVTKSAEDAIVGTSGLLVSRLCKRTRSLLTASKKRGLSKTVIYVNQFRTKIGVVMGDPRTMPGGNAPQFYASTIVYMHGGKEAVKADVHPTQPATK
jgi:recombination protein RecA